MRYKVFLPVLMILGLFMLSNQVFAIDTLVKDNWMVAEQDNKPVGIRHQQLWRTDTGYKYLIDYNFQLKLPDGTVSQVIKHWELEVDKRYLAKSFQTVDVVNGSVTHTTGEFAANQVKFKCITADGQEVVNNLKTEEPLYYLYSYYDYISFAGKLEAGQTCQALLFDLDTLAITPYSGTVTQDDNYKTKDQNLVLFAVSPTGDQNPAVLLNTKGDYYRWFDPVHKLTCRKIERSEIKGLSELPLLYFVISGNCNVLLPLRSIESRIQVIWKNIPGNEFRFEDNRQKLSNPKEASAKNQALITIKKDERDFSGTVTLPVTDKKLTSYLANDQVISPALPVIKELAGAILNGETDGWQAACKLADWVHNSVQPGIQPEILNTKKILEQKKGRSAEYAILFAALARAAGLPVRIVYGLRYQDNLWVEHVWNEVWLREWVAVDAYLNQTAPDCLLLKLFQCDATLDIRKFREKILGNLSIYIHEVRLAELNETELNSAKTGVYGKTYINQEFGCSLKTPENWELMEVREEDQPVLVIQSLANQNITGLLIMFKTPPGTTAAQILGERFPELNEALTQYELTKELTDFLGKEFVMLNDNNIAVPDGPTGSNQFRQQNWLTEDGENGYLLVLLAPDVDWPGCEADFQKIRANFKFLNK